MGNQSKTKTQRHYYLRWRAKAQKMKVAKLPQKVILLSDTDELGPYAQKLIKEFGYCVQSTM